MLGCFISRPFEICKTETWWPIPSGGRLRKNNPNHFPFEGEQNINKELLELDLINKLLNAGEVAKILSISRAFAYQLMNRGELRTVAIGTARRVRPEDLRKYIQENIQISSNWEFEWCLCCYPFALLSLRVQWIRLICTLTTSYLGVESPFLLFLLLKEAKRKWRKNVATKNVATTKVYRFKGFWTDLPP